MNNGEKIITDIIGKEMPLATMVIVAIADIQNNILSLEGQGREISRESLEELSSENLKALSGKLITRCHTLHNEIKIVSASKTSKAFPTDNELVETLRKIERIVLAKIELEITRATNAIIKDILKKREI